MTITRFFAKLLLPAILIGTCFPLSATENIPLSALSQYPLSFIQPESANRIPALPLTGTVEHLPGAAYEINLPFQIQQMLPLVKQGQVVEQGQKIAKIEGREMAHFFDEIHSARVLFDLAERNYQANAGNNTAGVIKNPEWLGIVRAYEEARLQLEHAEHIEPLLSREGMDDYYLMAPIKGRVMLGRQELIHGAMFSGVSLVPEDALFVRFSVPVSSVDSISGAVLPNLDCELEIVQQEQVSQGYMLNVWARPLASACELRLGDHIKVEPFASQSSWLLPRSAVFTLDEQSLIAVKRGDTLTQVAVEIVKSRGDMLYVRSDADLSASEVLTSSTSIVQGMLLGMGD